MIFLMIVKSYLMKRKIKKIFLEIISHTLIIYIYIILINEIANDQDLVKLTRGLDKGDWTTSNMVSLLTMYTKGKSIHKNVEKEWKKCKCNFYVKNNFFCEFQWKK